MKIMRPRGATFNAKDNPARPLPRMRQSFFSFFLNEPDMNFKTAIKLRNQFYQTFTGNISIYPNT